MAAEQVSNNASPPEKVYPLTVLVPAQFTQRNAEAIVISA